MYLIIQKKGKGWGIYDTRDCVTEYYREEDVRKIAEKLRVWGVSYNGITIIKRKFVDFDELVSCFKKYLARVGVEMPYEERFCTTNADSWEWNTRFIGGMSNWYCGDDENGYCEDRCDAEQLKRSERMKIRKACEEFYKDIGVFADWHNDSEKGWSCFSFM